MDLKDKADTLAAALIKVVKAQHFEATDDLQRARRDRRPAIEALASGSDE